MDESLQKTVDSPEEGEATEDEVQTTQSLPQKPDLKRKPEIPLPERPRPISLPERPNQEEKRRIEPRERSPVQREAPYPSPYQRDVPYQRDYRDYRDRYPRDKSPADRQMDGRIERAPMDARMDSRLERIPMDARMDSRLERIPMDARMDSRLERIPMDARMDSRLERIPMDARMERPLDSRMERGPIDRSNSRDYEKLERVPSRDFDKYRDVERRDSPRLEPRYQGYREDYDRGYRDERFRDQYRESPRDSPLERSHSRTDVREERERYAARWAAHYAERFKPGPNATPDVIATYDRKYQEFYRYYYDLKVKADSESQRERYDSNDRGHRGPSPRPITPTPVETLRVFQEAFKARWADTEESQLYSIVQESKRMDQALLQQEIRVRQARFETEMATWELNKWEHQSILWQEQLTFLESGQMPLDGYFGATIGGPQLDVRMAYGEMALMDI